MSSIERIKHHFNENSQLNFLTLEKLASGIQAAADAMVQCLLAGHKILTCGNGSSAANAQHFTSKMLNRFETDRPSLPAIALSADAITLSAIADDYNYKEVFAKQIKALGHSGDILLVIFNNSLTKNILPAIRTAQDRQLTIIALAGEENNGIELNLSSQDIELRVPSSSIARVQEMHLLILHCLCDCIDKQIFSHGASHA